MYLYTARDNFTKTFDYIHQDHHFLVTLGDKCLEMVVTTEKIEGVKERGQ